MSVQRTMILVWVLALVALTLVAAIQYQRDPLMFATDVEHKTVLIGDTRIIVEVADTPALQVRGLSGHTSLHEGEGMLFIFDEADKHGIWMKDMNFAIDILWADTEGTIVTIEEEVSPDTYPQAFYPSEPARYVLEVPAGFAGRTGLAVGQKLVVE